MRNYILVLGVVVGLCALLPAAKAEGVDVGLVGLIGTGVDTGKAANNPYALQLGGAAELYLSGWVLGARATRSIGTNSHCTGSNCAHAVDDLVTLGADLGWDWQLLKILHISPRLGVGQVREKNDGLRAPYLEPGGVVDINIAIFTLGADLRYRVAVKDNIASGFLAYARLGLRF
jgi:hypothetical protein